jgi:adenosylcobinamide kinase/adenosylcobinamide-phosphate guanylyltransferase
MLCSHMAIILIGGGSRSGKSQHALLLARQHGRRLGFIATAQPLDDEMRERIRLHQQERSPDFTTIEEPIAVASAIERHSSDFDAIVVDCLTLWLSNLAASDIEPQTGKLIESALATSTQVILVTNEVGCGIVPDNAVARRFRDDAGRLNQRVAEAASEVYWMVFGCALRVK